MRANRSAKQEIKAQAAAVRGILNAWDPIPLSPDDEYDCLVDHIVSALHRGVVGPTELAALISSEMTHHFGIETSESEVFTVAAAIATYWDERSN